MKRVLIIAYGNPLRSDDGLAWHAAEELRRRKLYSEIEIITRHQLTPELSHAVSESDLVIFVDATREGEPGELICEPLVPRPLSRSFSHELSAPGILNLANQLYGKCPDGFLVSICGEDFEHGEALSPRVAAELPLLVSLIEELARTQTKSSAALPLLVC
jgi:hydrogenase maturation protease